jgi:nitrate reductase (cytochrome), electron transfer subunit
MDLRTWARVALAAAMVWMGADLVPAVETGTAAEAVKIKGLRGGTPMHQDNPPIASHQERDHAVADRDFVQQPPLIPHTTAGYQITKNFNKCMDCHAWRKTKASGATKVSVTHFRTREGMELDNVSPRRYFCTQCHVAQTDAKPLVENTFQRARGLQ